MNSDSPIVFYYVSGSPFAWTIWLALEHKEIEYTLELLSVDAGDLKAPEFRTLNPHGKVPVITQNGFALYETAAIIDYLDEVFPRSGSRLWPNDVQIRATGRRIMNEIQHYLYPPVRRMVEELLLRRSRPCDEKVIAESRCQASGILRILKLSSENSFLLGDRVSAADFALYPVTAILGRLHARCSDLRLASILPEFLPSWQKRIEVLPYYDKTIPPHWRTAL